MDVYGKALKAFFEGVTEEQLWLNTSYGEPEEMPLWYFFREYDEMPELEKIALTLCEGKVLDVGAGTGCHALCLQQMGYDVLGIDISGAAVDIMRNSGVRSVQKADFFDVRDMKFDTILCLMNGIGFIGQLQRLEHFLEKSSTLLNPGGQLIFDSSDISYLYEGVEQPGHYYGEVSFQYEFRGEKGSWFDWVYIDYDTLVQNAEALGWNAKILHEDKHRQYLAVLTKVN